MLMDFDCHWNRSGQNDPTQAPKFATDDITLYAFYTLYIIYDEMCPLLYWGQAIPAQAQVELGIGSNAVSHTDCKTFAGSHQSVRFDYYSETTTIHLRLDEASTSSTSNSRESHIHETCQQLGATMNDLKDKIANRRIPADQQAHADSQYLELSQNYLDQHILNN
jgi:hypothetical protein